MTLSLDPIRRKQELAARRIRGVGAMQRATGHAYGRLSSRQRESYGSQRAFGEDMDAAVQRQAAEEGRRRARQETPANPPTQTPPELGSRPEDVARKRQDDALGGAPPSNWDRMSNFQRSRFLIGQNQKISAERFKRARMELGQPPMDNSIRR